MSFFRRREVPSAPPQASWMATEQIARYPEPSRQELAYQTWVNERVLPAVNRVLWDIHNGKPMGRNAHHEIRGHQAYTTVGRDVLSRGQKAEVWTSDYRLPGILTAYYQAAGYEVGVEAAYDHRVAPDDYDIAQPVAHSVLIGTVAEQFLR